MLKRRTYRSLKVEASAKSNEETSKWLITEPARPITYQLREQSLLLITLDTSQIIRPKRLPYGTYYFRRNAAPQEPEKVY